MDVQHELPPPQHLPDEPLLGVEGQLHGLHLLHHPLREEAVEVEEGGDAGVEEAPGAPGHGVLVGAEVLHARLPGPAPHLLHLLGGGRDGFGRHRSGPAGEALLHQLHHLPGDGVGFEGGRLGGRRLSVPELPVVRVVGVLPPGGRAVLHEDPGALPHGAVEGVLPPGPVGVAGGGEVLLGGEPPLVLGELQEPLLHQGPQVLAELPLGGAHAREPVHLPGQGPELGGEVLLPGEEADRHPGPGRLQGEVALAGEEEGELLLVVGAAPRLPGALHQDDPHRSPGLPGDGAQLQGELVVWVIDPAVGLGGGAGLAQGGAEALHGRASGVGRPAPAPHGRAATIPRFPARP